MLNNNKKQETQFFGTKCGNANSIAAGYATETTNYGEIATGILNKSTKGDNPNSPEGVVGDPKATLFSVGCGTKEERKNALEVKGDGSVIISGKDGSDVNISNGIKYLSDSCIIFGNRNQVLVPYIEAYLTRPIHKVNVGDYMYAAIGDELQDDTDPQYIYDMTTYKLIKVTESKTNAVEHETADFFNTEEPLNLSHELYLDNEKTGNISNLEKLTIKESGIFEGLPYVCEDDTLEDDKVPQYIYDATDKKWITVNESWYITDVDFFNTEEPLNLSHKLLYHDSENIYDYDRTAGTASVVMGYKAKATGDYSTAIGWGTNAMGENSTALGSAANAMKDDSIAFGYRSEANGDFSIAMGRNTTAIKDYSIAVGTIAKASGDSAIAIGNKAQATGSIATALGCETQANGSNATALGSSTKANGNFTTALGGSAQTAGVGATALGYISKATSDYSTALGYNAQATGECATAIGNNAQATGNNAVALGNNTQATSVHSIALGNNAQATDIGAIALGLSAKATKSDSIALGLAAKAIGLGAIALGLSSEAADSSTALGYYAKAADTSTALGYRTQATGMCTTALGSFAQATGITSIALGYLAKTSTISKYALGGFDVNKQTEFNIEEITYSQYGNKKYLIGLGGYDGTNLTVTNNNVETLNPDIKSVQEIINSKADLIPIVTSTDATISLQPNKKYEITAGDTLVLTFTEPSDKTHKNEYLFSINTGSSVSTITFQIQIIWNVEPVIAANKHYEINVQYSQGKYWGTVHTWNIPS